MSLSPYCATGNTSTHFTSNILNEFGSQLRQMRMDRKLSEVDLAWESGITRAHLQDIEEGMAHVDLGLLSQIAPALGVTLSCLVGTL